MSAKEDLLKCFSSFFVMMVKRGQGNAYIYDTKQDFLALKCIKENIKYCKR